MSRVAWLTAIVLLVASCSPGGWVVDWFSTRNVCPTDQLVVRERADVRVSAFVCKDPAAWASNFHRHARSEIEEITKMLTAACGLEAPTDVAADPTRRALWQADVDARRATIDERYLTPIEVSGCGAHGIYTCLIRRGGCKDEFRMKLSE